ncbi:hypothetical protein SLE2022_046860 [Rubroshorea leprosula]
MGRLISTTPLCILLRLLLLLLLFLTRHTMPVNSLPLSTNSRWIVDDQTGQRVKLACANWVSHLEPIVAEGLAEGLSKQPLDVISKKILSMGFNCVRLTCPRAVSRHQ